MKNVNVLQSRIESKAKERFTTDFENLAELIRNNPIGRDLRIDKLMLINTSGTVSDTFFNRSRITEIGKERTNIEEIKDKLIEKYIKEETDNLLSKLEILSEYIGSSL